MLSNFLSFQAAAEGHTEMLSNFVSFQFCAKHFTEGHFSMTFSLQAP